MLKQIAALAFAGAAAGLAGAGYITFRNFLHCKADKHQCDELPDEDYTKGFGSRYIAGAKWNLNAEGEAVTITSHDGLRLVGKYIAADNAVRSVLLVHGWFSTYFKDFSEMARWYLDNGSNVLFIDQRAQRDSEGTYLTMGTLESEDVAQWAHVLAEKTPGLPIYLHGVSMGAATVMMAQGENLPGAVAGIIEDCGFTSPWDIAASVAKNGMHVPTWPLLPIVNIYARLLAHFDLKAKSAPDILAHAKIPMLFIHGTADDFVPPHMTVRNYMACAAPKTLCMVDGASHAMSWFFDTKKYKAALASFLAENDSRTEL